MQGVLSSNKQITLISSSGSFNGQYTIFCSKVPDCKKFKFANISIIGPRLASGASFLTDLFMASFLAPSHTSSVQNKEARGITMRMPKSVNFPYHILLLECGERKDYLPTLSNSQVDVQQDASQSLAEHIGSFVSVVSNMIVIDATEVGAAEFKESYSIFLRSAFSTYSQLLNDAHNINFKLICFVVVSKVDQETDSTKETVNNAMQEIFVDSVPKDSPRTFHDSVHLQIFPLYDKKINPHLYWQDIHSMRSTLESMIADIQRPDNPYGQVVSSLADSPRIFCKVWEQVVSNKVPEIYSIYTSLGDSRCKAESNDCYLFFNNSIKWIETLIHEFRRVPSVALSGLAKRSRECNTFRLFQDIITISLKAISRYDQATSQYTVCSRDKWRKHLYSQMLSKMEQIAKELATIIITNMLNIIHTANSDIQASIANWNGQGDLTLVSEDLTNDGIDTLCQLLTNADKVYREYKEGYQIEFQTLMPKHQSPCTDILEEQFVSPYLENMPLGTEIKGIYEPLRILYAGILSWCYKTVSPLGEFCDISQLLNNAREEENRLCTEVTNSLILAVDRIIDVQLRQSCLSIQESISLTTKGLSDRLNALCDDILTKGEGLMKHALKSLNASSAAFSMDNVMTRFSEATIGTITNEIKRIFEFKADFISRLTKYVDINFVSECRNRSLYSTEQAIENRYILVKKDIENYLSEFKCIPIATKYKSTSIEVISEDMVQSVLHSINIELIKRHTAVINGFHNYDIMADEVEMVNIPAETINLSDVSLNTMTASLGQEPL